MNDKTKLKIYICIVVFLVSVMCSLTVSTILNDRKSIQNARSDSAKSETTYRRLTESIEESERTTGELSRTNEDFERILEEIRKENRTQK